MAESSSLTFWQHFREAYPAYADSVATAFGERPPWLRQLIKWVAFPFTLEMVRLGHHYELLVNQDGSVQRASEWLLRTCSAGVTAHGAENIPSEGALLIVANHAGMGDAIAIHTFLPRRDIYTVVFRRGLLAGLPSFVNYCIVIDEDDPIGSIRQIVRVLKEGHAVLLFPYGQIEHDPALDLHKANSTLEGWSRSIEIIARQVTGIAVLPAAVGGVLSRRGLRHPITRRFKTFNRQSFLRAPSNCCSNPIGMRGSMFIMAHPSANLSHVGRSNRKCRFSLLKCINNKRNASVVILPIHEKLIGYLSTLFYF